MIFYFLLKVLLLQGVAFALIIFILKKILDRNLMRMAMGDLEFLDTQGIPPSTKEISVTSHQNLKEKTKQQITHIIQRKFPQGVKVVFNTDGNLRGGMVIKVDRTCIDCSLLERLRGAGWIKKV